MRNRRRRDDPPELSFPPYSHPANARPVPARRGETRAAIDHRNGRFSNCGAAPGRGRPYETTNPAFTAVGGIPGRHSGEGRNPGVNCIPLKTGGTHICVPYKTRTARRGRILAPRRGSAMPWIGSQGRPPVVVLRRVSLPPPRENPVGVVRERPAPSTERTIAGLSAITSKKRAVHEPPLRNHEPAHGLTGNIRWPPRAPVLDSGLRRNDGEKPTPASLGMTAKGQPRRMARRRDPPPPPRRRKSRLRLVSFFGIDGWRSSALHREESTVQAWGRQQGGETRHEICH